MLDASSDICPNCGYEENTFEVYESENTNDTGFEGSVFDIFDCFGTSIYADDEEYTESHVCQNDIVEGFPDNFDEPVAKNHNCANDLDAEIAEHDCQNDFFEDSDPNKINSSDIQYGNREKEFKGGMTPEMLAMARSQQQDHKQINIHYTENSDNASTVKNSSDIHYESGNTPQQAGIQRNNIQQNKKTGQNNAQMKPQNIMKKIPKEFQAGLSPQMLAMIQQQQRDHQSINVSFVGDMPVKMPSNTPVQAKEIDRRSKKVLCAVAFIIGFISPFLGIVFAAVISKLSKTNKNTPYIIAFILGLALNFILFYILSFIE